MKILIVNKFLFPNGGSETYIFGLGKQLEKMGHEVQYFGMEHPDNIVGNRINSYTPNMDFHAEGKIANPMSLIDSQESRKKLRAVLYDFKPDVVHFNNINFQLTPSVIDEVKAVEKATGDRIKTIYTAHDSQWVCPNHLMRIPSTGENCMACIDGDVKNCTKNNCIHNSKAKSVLGTSEAQYHKLKKTYAKVDKVICPSNFLAGVLAHNPLIKDKIVVMPNFVEKLDIGTTFREEYVLYFGRFSEEKGVKTLIEAVKELKHIIFYFAGNGPLEDNIKDIPNIANLGFVKGEELAKLIAKARFTICPSECYENSPFSVKESLAYGTPVLASNIGGIPEIVEDGVTGELFESGNKEALKATIEKFWMKRDIVEKYIANCENVSVTSVEDYAKQFIDLIETL